MVAVLLAALVFIFSAIPTVFSDTSSVSDGSSGGSTVVGKKYSDAELGISAAGKALEKKGYQSVLIAGIDSTYDADIIMVLSIDASGNANLFSVARDTYMQLSDKSAYNIGGKVRAFQKSKMAHSYCKDRNLGMMRMLNRHLDLNIREYICLSWDCTADLVNKLRALGLNVTGNITSADMANAINKTKPLEAAVSKSSAFPLQGWRLCSI